MKKQKKLYVMSLPILIFGLVWSFGWGNANSGPKKPVPKKWDQLLLHKKLSKRKEAIKALRHMGPRASFAVLSLKKALNDSHWSIREGATRWFGENGLSWRQMDVSVDLLRGARDADSRVRVASFWALGFVSLAHRLAAFKVALESSTEKTARVREASFVLLGRLGLGKGKARTALLLGAKDKSWQVRSAAVWSLSQLKFRDEASQIVFAKAVSDLEPSVRLMGVKALVRLGGLAIPHALKMLRSNVFHIQKHGLDILASCGHDSSLTIASISRLLSHSHFRLREASGIALGRIGRPAKGAIPKLVKAFIDPKPEVKSAAIWALGRMGKAAVPALARLLRTKNQHRKVAAAQALSAMGPQAAGATLFLVDAMLDPNWIVRREVAWALFRLGSAIRGKIPHSMLPILLNGLQDRSWKIRYCLLKVLGQMGTKAKIVVGWFGPKAVSTLGAVQKLKSDKDLRVRRAAYEVYKVIQTP